MKVNRVAAGLLVLLSAAGPLTAQAPSGPVPAVANPFGLGLIELLGPQSFSATAILTLEHAGRDEPMLVSMKLAAMPGSSRMELDLTSLPNVGPEVVAELKARGMETLVTIARTNEGKAYFVYPGLKAFVVGEIPGPASGLVLETRPLSPESLDGRPAKRSAVVIRGPEGSPLTVTTWRAADVALPLQVRMSIGAPGEAGARTVSMRFKDVSTTAPAKALFDPPSDYRSFTTMTAFSNWIVDRVPPSRPVPRKK